jgi:hypothetical protein
LAVKGGRTVAIATAQISSSVPMDEYRAWPHVSQSTLKVLRDRSPAHAYEYMNNPPEQTPALIMGTAVHMATLQPELFDQHYAMAPECDRRTKEGKAQYAAFQEEHAGATILSADDYMKCLLIAKSVRSHPSASKLLIGEAEQSATWIDTATGLTCKARFDMVSKVGMLADLKTTCDASRAAFERSIYNYFYYGQASFYLNGAHELGIPADYFTFIAVEKEPPYAVAVYHLRGEVLDAGREELKPLMQTYAKCVETDTWPGYADEAVEIGVPAWAWRRLEEGDAS